MVRYFFYLAWNWSFSLAFFIICHEIKGKKKYGTNTIGVDELKNLPEDKRKHASVYQPINYYTAEKLFNELSYEDVQGGLLDLGCGKGRIFGIGAAYGFKEITGVDFSEVLCKKAIVTAQNVAALYPEIRMKVIYQDAGQYTIPASVSTLFLFNPFDAEVLEKVLEQINATQASFPRSIKILYANPVWKKVLENAGFVETFYFQKRTYLEGSILEREKAI